MQYRVSKSGKSVKSKDCEAIFSVLLQTPGLMALSCSYCRSRDIECPPIEGSASRCRPCVANNQPRCDAKPLSPAQLRKIGATHALVEEELDRAEEEAEQAQAKVRRLRQQKKMWFEKMMRAVSRGIDNVEELERVERLEAERAAAAESAGRPRSTDGRADAVIDDWEELYGHVELDPSLLVDFGLARENPPTPLASPSGGS
jgi:hypothetical protein